MTFDMEATFGDDYLYFYEESIDDEHSDADTAEILGLLDLAPGSHILDAPCGHGRIARRLAAAGMVVTGVDVTPDYLEQARADPQLPRGRRHLPRRGCPCPAGRRAFRRRGVLAELVRLLRRRRLSPGARGVPPGPPAGREGGDRHDAPRRGRPALHACTRRGGRPTRRRHHGRGLDLRPGRGPHGDPAHRAPGRALRRASYFVRLPTPPEWVVWLEAAGFRDVVFRAGGGGPLELDSWELVVVATA